MAAPHAQQTEALHDLVREWDRRVRTNIDSHNMAERHFDRLNAACLIGSIASMTTLGVLAASFNLTAGNNRFIVIALSVFAGTASVLLGVRDYGSKASAHRLAARQYSALRRRIENASATAASDNALKSDLDSIEAMWNEFSAVIPNVPNRLRTKAERNATASRLLLPSAQGMR